MYLTVWALYIGVLAATIPLEKIKHHFLNRSRAGGNDLDDFFLL